MTRRRVRRCYGFFFFFLFPFCSLAPAYDSCRFWSLIALLDEAEDEAKGPDADEEERSGWTIPVSNGAGKEKGRLPAGEGGSEANTPTDVSKSAPPELARLAPEDDDGHIEYKVRAEAQKA